MSEKLSGYKLPGGIRCCQCGTELIGASPVSGGKAKGFREGTLVICFHCATPMRATKTGMVKLTDVQVNALDQTSKRILSITLAKVREM